MKNLECFVKHTVSSKYLFAINSPFLRWKNFSKDAITFVLPNKISEFCKLRRVPEVFIKRAVLKQQFKITKTVFLVLYKHSLVMILFSLSTQAVAVLSCNTGQVFPAVQCYENGPFSPWTSLSYWATQCKWTGIGRICHLQRGAGKLLFWFGFSDSFFKAV